MNVRSRHQFLCYTIEGLNSFSTVFYFTYIYFQLREKYGFGDAANLAVAALLGVIYAFVAWQAGKFAQRYGNLNALKLGFSVMAVSYLLGSQWATAPG
ncbi:MAG TPA: hypothetical protein VF607_08720, partial [Verrucomicrobiae bacterium]